MFVTYFFVLLLLQRVDVNLTISRDTIAHFRCCNCDPYPSDCCIGSLILPYIILTSAYCAENCKTVILGKTKNVTIIRFYRHPHYRNFVLTGSRSIIKRNDVALVHVTNDPKTERPYLKLSALQVGALDGRTGLIPVFNAPKPRLLRTIVQRCRKGTSMSSMGYVICTVNKHMNSSRACHPQQGVPLLIEGKIIALSGFVDKLMCINEQRYFVAVGPALLWMRSVIQKLSQQNANQEHLYAKKQTFKAVIKKTYYVTITKKRLVLGSSLRANIVSRTPDPHNTLQEATTTDVINETENPVNVDQETNRDTSSTEQQDATFLINPLDVSQIESPMILQAEDKVEKISSSTFSSTNFLQFLSRIGYYPGNESYYSYRRSFQNVSSTVT